MPGRVPASYGSVSGTGTDQRYVPLGQTTCFLLSLVANRSGMLFANVCVGLSVPVSGNFGFGVFWAFWLLFGVWCIWGVLALLGSLSCTKLGFLLVCLLLDTPLGRRLVGALPL